MATTLPELLRIHRPDVGWRGYPKWVRTQAIAEIRDRRGRGETWTTIASELGLAVGTVRAWDEQTASSSKVQGFRPVVLSATTPGREGGLRLTGPHGVRVEGLSIEVLAALRQLLA